MAYRDNNRPFIREDRKVYEHDEIEIEYRGIHAKIKKDGKVILRKDVEGEVKDGESIEYDEIEVPANLIFRLQTLLNNTKKVKYEPYDEKEKV